MPIEIADPTDPRLADYRGLKDPGRPSREASAGIFAAEGRLAVARLLDSAYEVVSLLVEDRRADAVSRLIEAATTRRAPVYLARRQVLAHTVGFDLHRGVVAIARRPPPADPHAVVSAATQPAAAATGEVRPALLLVLEGLNDHENLGALFRNAAAFGVGAVILDPTCADPLYRRSVRVSLGHVLSVPFARVAPWPGGLGALLGGRGVPLAALTPGADTRPHGNGAGGPEAGDGVGGPEGGTRRPTESLRRWAARRAGEEAVALMLGAEGAGLTAGALAAADDVVSIPMAAGVDSLNVATAAAVALYEMRRTAGPAPA